MVLVKGGVGGGWGDGKTHAQGRLARCTISGNVSTR